MIRIAILLLALGFAASSAAARGVGRFTLDNGVSHTNPLTAQVVEHTSALMHEGASFTLTIPPSFAGRTYIVQGMVLGYSSTTGLALTMTDGHLLIVSP